ALPVAATPPLPFDTSAPPYGHLTVQGSYGIESTPVVDRGRSTIFVVVRSVEPTGYVQRLHAIDLASGRERGGSPVEIQGIDATSQMNRSGLALSQSNVLVGFTITSKVNEADYHGRVIAFDAATLAQTGSFCTTCGVVGVGGGVWQTGRPPAVDKLGNVYY